MCKLSKREAKFRTKNLTFIHNHIGQVPSHDKLESRNKARMMVKNEM